MSINSIFSRRRSKSGDGNKVLYDCRITAENLKKIFSDCGDFEQRGVSPGQMKRGDVTVCWLDGVVSGTAVSECVIRPLTDPMRLGGVESAADCVRTILQGAVYSYSVKQRETMDELVTDLVQGFCAIIFDSLQLAVTFETRTSNTRAVSEPTIEKAVMAAKDAFVETLRINTSLVRRKVRTPELKTVETTVGRRSGTRVCLMYIHGIANGDIIAETKKRLDAIDIDGLVAAGNLEAYIVDEPRSPFPQLMHTERPDKFAAELLAGRIGLIADGLPIGFLLPVTLASFIRVTEDKAKHFLSASFLLLLRWLSILLSIALPALFVAVAMYHQEMIPHRLLMSMIDAKQKVPFSVSVEVLSMLISFELLREAGIRLPNPVGDTISIIGALVVGQSAVEARVVSPVAVIVVATAGICGFTQPSQDMGAALRIIRLLLVILVIALGMFGLMLGIALLVYHLCTLESYGVSYTASMSESGLLTSLQDFIQLPLWRDKYRDPALRTRDKRTQK